MVSRFQSARPPTPPPTKAFAADKDADNIDNNNHADNIDDADVLLDFLSDPFATNPKPPADVLVASKGLLSTPQTSPAVPSSSASRKKRVNFDAEPCAIPTSGFPQYNSTPLHSSPLRPLPQTRVSKPLKSILKPMDAASTPPPTADEPTPAHKYKSFADMLESIMKQLASSTRSARVDAYHSLHRTMQAYDKIPDMQALLDKMGLLTQFIRRDVQAVSVSGSGLDSQLIAQALKLLMALVRIPELKSAMSDDFCIFVVDRIIQVASDKDMPKTIVNTHLATLMQQNFRPKAMTAPRVERILDTMDTIHDRVTGQSVLAYRIRIYRKLIQQKPEVMAKHTERWFKHTVQSLLSTQKDIYQSALDTAITAAKMIGADPQVKKAALAVLNQQKKDGNTIAKIVTKELDKMLATENAICVPQIWSAITALLAGCLNAKQLPAMADWLKLFNKCLDHSDDNVRLHANIAFGFLVYAVNIKEDTDAVWSKICLTLPRHHLQHPRRGQLKTSGRDAATSAYFLLLYYSLNPLASHRQLDRYWKEFVAEFWSPPKSKMSPAHAMAACRIVSALLNGSRKPWDAQRALDLRQQAMMQREELPLLDPRWVRKSLATILEFAEKLLDATPWAMDDTKDEPAKTMWLSLLNSLNVASSQEVITSSGSKDAMAHLVNLLRRMWDSHGAQLALSQQKEDNWANKFCYLLETIVEKTGAFGFADKCLARNQEDEIEVASTPSSRSRPQGPRTSPLLYFVDLLVNQSEGRLADPVRLRALNLLVEPCFKSSNTRLTKLELLRDCATTMASSSTDSLVTTTFLAHLASLTNECIREPLDATGRGSRQLGKEYELAVELLSLGGSQFLKQLHGQELLTCFAETVKNESGEGAVVIAVIEKVSERILSRIPEPNQRIGLAFLNIILKNLPKVISRRTIEQARQELWPSSPNPGRNTDFDPYNYLYTAINSIGCTAYRELSLYHVEEVRSFLIALGNTIRTCPLSMLAVYLRKVQEAICPWIEDGDKKLQVKEQPLQDLHIEVLNLWKEVCAAIERLPNITSQTLVHLEPLIAAGFSSRRRGIISKSTTMWNTTFGKQEVLRYPALLEKALRRVRNTVELSLPCLQIGTKDAKTPLLFYESDDNSEPSRRKFQSPRVRASPFRVAKSARKSRSPAVSANSSKKPSIRQNPKARLRHDNSQIDFEPIDSSPSNPFVQDSQILTERQRETHKRQEEGNKLFANIAATSSPARPQGTVSAPSPLEVHSDALSVDDLPMEHDQTPLRRLPAVGPMDVFVGSSPTPRNRIRLQEVGNDNTSVATPTAIHTIQLANVDEELGSSPPRFEKNEELNAGDLKSNDMSLDVVSDSFQYGQPSDSFGMFDEGTTFDDITFPEAGDTNMMDSDANTSDVPSSTIDLQLTAQIDAEMQTHKDGKSGKKSRTRSQDLAEAAIEKDDGNDTEFDEAPIQMSTPARNTRSSTSRIGDSFSSQAGGVESSQLRSIRRSGRRFAPSSPIQPPKRGRPRKSKQVTEESPVEPSPAPVEILDNITVAVPKVPQSAKKARKSLPANLQSELLVPDSIRKRGITRSASSLSQVETHSEDVAVEENSPALKRAKRSIDQDVSGAKSTPGISSQTRRLSHVHVTPKGPQSVAHSERQAVNEHVPTVGEQNNNVTPQLPADDGTSQPQQPAAQQQSQGSGDGLGTPNRSFADRVILTPRSIISHLRSLKNALFRNSSLVLGRREEREIDDELFHIRRGIHAAGRRSEEGGEANQEKKE